MKLQRTKRGFTLIELMVVITIIGILATGAVSVYTSQIQKARDSNRVTAIKALQSSVEQAYSDASEYPGVEAFTAGSSSIANCVAGNINYNMQCLKLFGYMEQLPADPKTGQIGNGAPLDYAYNVGDKNSVSNQVFELSTGFEAAGSLSSKANDTVDNGGDSNRMEIGNSNLVTRLSGGDTIAIAEGISDNTSVTGVGGKSCRDVAGNNGAAGNPPILISGNCD